MTILRSLRTIPWTRRERLALRFVLLGLIVLVILLALGLLGVRDEPELTVTFFDVGQGDGILIEAPGGQDILVDGGPDRRVLEKLGHAMPFFDHTLELVVLTHPHADHVAGLVDVLDRYEVERVLTADTPHQSSIYRRWQEQLKEGSITVDLARTGRRYRFGELSLTVLSPRTDEMARPADLNDASIVLLLDFRGVEMLLMGDAGLPVEQVILDDVPDVDLLKVGHHGSRTATGDAFLDRAKPEIAVVSVGGRNRYGHPHPSTLERFKSHGIRVFRTDRDGDVTLKTNGFRLQMTTSKGVQNKTLTKPRSFARISCYGSGRGVRFRDRGSVASTEYLEKLSLKPLNVKPVLIKDRRR